MKKYSTQAYYNYAKHMLEGEATLASTEEVDPDLKALYEAVDSLESKKPGSAEQFVKVIQTKYGVTSTNSLKKTLTDCLKVAVGGLSVSGFITAIHKAIESGTILYRHIFSGNYVSKSYVTNEFALIILPCLLISFIFYKILKYIVSSYNKTESINTLTVKKLNKVRKQKAILESQLFVDRFNDLLIESDAGKVSTLNATAQKAYAICKKMFGWIKKKVAEGWGWIKKHPYITIAFLIVIGCVLYYINVLKGQISSANQQIGRLNANIKNLKTIQLDANAAKRALEPTRNIANDIITHANDIYKTQGVNAVREYISDEMAKAYGTMNNAELAALLKNLEHKVMTTGSNTATNLNADHAYNVLRDLIGSKSDLYVKMSTIFNN